MPGLKCAYLDFCKNGKVSGGCDSCIYYLYSRTPINQNNFLSCKCGSQASLCAHLHDADYCDDCDPFDAPCSLYKYSGVL